MKCPVHGCKARPESSKTLLVHLMQYHKKNDLAVALVHKVMFEAPAASTAAKEV